MHGLLPEADVTAADRDDPVAEPRVERLLAASLGSTGRVAEAIAAIRQGQWELFRVTDPHEGRTQGLIAVDFCSGGDAMIRALAVEQTLRGRGIGRHLIETVRGTGRCAVLVAETDGDGVGFYRRCGFDIFSLGELYPGVERFRCTWRSSA